MATIIKPTAVSNFRSKATANSRWMIVTTADYSITAFEDNTRIFKNGALDTTLNRQEVKTRSYAAGDIISSDVRKGFSFSALIGGKTGICYAWEGTLFGHRIDRYSPTIFWTATRAAATVTITRQTSGTVVVNADVVQKDELKTYAASDTDDQYIITSNKPIAVYVDQFPNTGDAQDSLPLYPGSTDLFGTFSNQGHIISGASGTNNILIRGSNGTKRQITLSGVGAVTENTTTGPISAGGHFAGTSCRIISDKPIFCESQADFDGGEQTPFASKEAFGTEFVIPEDENEWVKLVSDVPASYEVYDSANTYLGGGSLAGTFYDSARTVGATHPGERVGGIYQVRIGDTTEGASNLTQQKNLIRTSAPVYGVFESENDDETVLFARAKMNNTSVHVNPKIVTNGLILYLDAGNKKSYSGSGSTWTDLSKQNNNATLSNFAVGGLNGGTLTADGANSVAEINAAASLQPASITIEAMVLPIYNNQNYANVISYPPNDDAHQSPWMIYAIYLQHVSGNLTARPMHSRVGGTSVISDNGAFDFGVWNHLVFTFHNQAAKFYRDGVIHSTHSISPSTINYSGYENQNVFIGQNPSGSEDFEGEYSSIRLYNRALTDDEVKQNFNAIRGRFGL